MFNKTKEGLRHEINNRYILSKRNNKHIELTVGYLTFIGKYFMHIQDEKKLNNYQTHRQFGWGGTQQIYNDGVFFAYD